MGFKAKKFTNYIRDDRLHRVQAYVEKYGSNVTKLALDNRGRNALHLACHYSSIYCFGYLLKHKPNLMKTDHDGNVPLHWAIKSMKKNDRNVVPDIVLPLLKLCPTAQDVPNKDGITVRQILNDMGLNIEENGQQDESQDSFGQSLSDPDDELPFEDDDEIAFNAKLCCEMEEEYEESWGRYDRDYEEECDSRVPESYDEWADRMSAEYGRRGSFSHSRFQQSGKQYQNANKRSSEWTPSDQEQFEQHCHQEELARQNCLKKDDEKCRRLQQKLQFVMKYSKMFHSENNNRIHLCDLPWINCGTLAKDILDVLLADVETTDNVAKKRCLREQQVQWHPDKFLQKFGNRLAEEDKTDVISAVNQFSQVINAALDSLSSV